MPQYIVTDSELTDVANAIRIKGGTQAALSWPSGYRAAILAIPTGGSTDCYWRVRFYSQDGASLLYTEFVKNGDGCQYVYAELGWASTPGGSAVSGITDYIADNTDLYFAEAWTPIEYIGTSGTQWINTGVPGNTADLKMDLVVMPTVNNVDQGFVGCAWAANGFFLMVYGTGGSLWRFHTGGIAQNDGVASTADYAHIVLETTGFSVDGVSYPMAGGANLSGDIRLCSNFGSGYGRNASAKVKSVKIYSGTTLLKNLIPAIDPNGVACMRDLVNSAYLYNSGSGSFIVP